MWVFLYLSCSALGQLLRCQVGNRLIKTRFKIVLNLPWPGIKTSQLDLPIIIDKYIIGPNVSNFHLKTLHLFDRWNNSKQQVPNLRLLEMFKFLMMILYLLIKWIIKIIIYNLNNNLSTLMRPDEPQIFYSLITYFLGISRNYESQSLTSFSNFYHYEMSSFCSKGMPKIISLLFYNIYTILNFECDNSTSRFSCCCFVYVFPICIDILFNYLLMNVCNY